jgi:bifunctional non-homologous end joining protein LigD
MLLDRGHLDSRPSQGPEEALDQGHLHFTVDGERMMKGEWIMIA